MEWFSGRMFATVFFPLNGAAFRLIPPIGLPFVAGFIDWLLVGLFSSSVSKAQTSFTLLSFNWNVSTEECGEA